MKLRLAITCIWVFGYLGILLADDTAHIVVSAQDNWSRNLNNRQILLVPISPLSRIISTNIFARDVRRLTVTNGVCVFSNTVWGYYRMEISGTPFTAFNLLLGTNHSGLVSAAALVTNSAALPPDGATNYYSISQIDALLAGLGSGGGGGGSASNVFWSMIGTNITIITNVSALTFQISADVSHQEVINSTNGLATALIARMTDATNDLGTVLITRIGNATNDIYGLLVTRITDATNTLSTTLSTKITNATNDLATALIARITASTNSGNIAFVTSAAKTLGAYDASGTTNLNATELRSGTVADARLSGNVSLLGSSITESELGLSDLTTANASISAHGFLKKLSGTSTEYLDGSGNFSTPAGGSGWPTLNGRGTNPIVGGRSFGVQITNTANDELKFLSEQTGSTIATFNGGGITAPTFIGSGAALTSLAADQLTSGQVPNGRLTQSNAYTGTFNSPVYSNGVAIFNTDGSISSSNSITLSSANSFLFITNTASGNWIRETNGVVTIGPTNASATITLTGSSGAVLATSVTTSGGNITSGGHLGAGAGSRLDYSGRSGMAAPAIGIFSMFNLSDFVNFERLILGGGTSISASTNFPSLLVVTTNSPTAGSVLGFMSGTNRTTGAFSGLSRTANIISGGQEIATNSAPHTSAWTPGGMFIWNSNGSGLYVLKAGPGITTWTSTNVLLAP